MLTPSVLCYQEEEAHVLIDDLRTLALMLPAVLADVEPSLWHRSPHFIGSQEWTLHQTVAHLAAVAEFYCSMLQLALRQEVPTTPSFQRRDLPAINQLDIQRRQHFRSSELLAAFQKALTETAEIAQHLTAEQLSWPIMVPVFNRPVTILELLEVQVMHPGMIHAAQIACPVGKAPLWHLYDHALFHRMLARFFHLMTLVYWPERGGTLCVTLQFLIAGVPGGQWYVSISPQHCEACAGRADHPQLTLWFASANALCLLFTKQLPIGQALLSRKLFVQGNLVLATRMMSLFSPT